MVGEHRDHKGLAIAGAHARNILANPTVGGDGGVFDEVGIGAIGVLDLFERGCEDAGLSHDIAKPVHGLFAVGVPLVPFIYVEVVKATGNLVLEIRVSFDGFEAQAFPKLAVEGEIRTSASYRAATHGEKDDLCPRLGRRDGAA